MTKTEWLASRCPIPPAEGDRRDSGNGGRAGSRYPMQSDYALIDENARVLCGGFDRLYEAVDSAEVIDGAAYVVERQTVTQIVWDIAHEKGRP